MSGDTHPFLERAKAAGRSPETAFALFLKGEGKEFAPVPAQGSLPCTFCFVELAFLHELSKLQPCSHLQSV